MSLALLGLRRSASCDAKLTSQPFIADRFDVPHMNVFIMVRSRDPVTPGRVHALVVSLRIKTSANVTRLACHVH